MTFERPFLDKKSDKNLTAPVALITTEN